MPTYEYRCERCGHGFEVFQSMKDAALSVCAKELCPLNPWGEGKVKRLLGKGAGLIFKGSGFYSTDYRSPGYQEAAKKESGEGAKGGEKAAAAKDNSTAQPATKTAPSGSGTQSDSGNSPGSGTSSGAGRTASGDSSSAGSGSGSSSEKSGN
ncbi:MAG: zinc ribbon domain-containing protein [Verrucomicrobia bacterium]|nr:zinc ribbon domain-containing protein [Verrucomicrobiota bacterium]